MSDTMLDLRYRDLGAAPAVTVRIKALPEERTIMGYASAFGVVDAMDELILPGAFAQTLEEDSARHKVLWNHQGWRGATPPIGKPDVLKEDEIGLYYESRLSEIPLADEVLQLVVDEVVTENSIGYSLKWDDISAIDGPDGSVVWAIKKIKLWEVSPVIWGANQGAVMVGAKGLEEQAAWLTIRDGLDEVIVRVKSSLGSRSIIARHLKSERERFDHCSSDQECSSCGGCGKRGKAQAPAQSPEVSRLLGMMRPPTSTQRLLAALRQ